VSRILKFRVKIAPVFVKSLTKLSEDGELSIYILYCPSPSNLKGIAASLILSRASAYLSQTIVIEPLKTPVFLLARTFTDTVPPGIKSVVMLSISISSSGVAAETNRGEMFSRTKREKKAAQKRFFISKPPFQKIYIINYIIESFKIQFIKMTLIEIFKEI